MHAEKLGTLVEGSVNACPSEAVESHENACSGTTLKVRHVSRNVADI